MENFSLMSIIHKHYAHYANTMITMYILQLKGNWIFYNSIHKARWHEFPKEINAYQSAVTNELGKFKPG